MVLYFYGKIFHAILRDIDIGWVLRRFRVDRAADTSAVVPNVQEESPRSGRLWIQESSGICWRPCTGHRSDTGSRTWLSNMYPYTGNATMIVYYHACPANIIEYSPPF